MVTILRKCEGDLKALEDDFKKVCMERYVVVTRAVPTLLIAVRNRRHVSRKIEFLRDSPTQIYNGRIEATGNHKQSVLKWLADHGF